MGLWDTISEQANNLVASSGSNIGEFLKSNASNLFVKQGPPPTGNLTPAQIAAGQTGSPPPIAAPASGAVASMMSNPMIPMLAIGGLLAVVLLMKKGR